VKIVSVVGARPNFIKILPFIRAIDHHNLTPNSISITHVLVHTGQHFDYEMSDSFFIELEIPKPDYNLGVGSGSHGYQIGHTMIEFEKVLEIERPDWVVVVGDVNATIACSLAAKKLGIRVAHIEAGLRSNDWDMPEEVNRVVTDRIGDLLFTPCRFADANLKAEGVSDDRVKRVGNIMIDTFDLCRPKFASRNLSEILRVQTIEGRKTTPQLKADNYGMLTLHRPSNVDNASTLGSLLDAFIKIARQIPIIFPVHPRTRKRLEEFGLWERAINCSDLVMTGPLGYLDMMSLVLKARVILTDSGGLQEEATVSNVPCLTLRWNTERPVTLIEHGGTSQLVGNDPEQILTAFQRVLTDPQHGNRPELWDGRTSGRIVKILSNNLLN